MAGPLPETEKIQSCSNDPEAMGRTEIMTAEAIHRKVGDLESHVIETVVQADHGFVPGNILYHSGSAFEKALAVSEETVGRYLVVKVIDVDTFQVCQGALKISIDDANFAAAVEVGKFYMTSNVNNGWFVATDDEIVASYYIRNPIFTVRSITDNVVLLDVLPWRADTGLIIQEYSVRYLINDSNFGSIQGNPEQIVESNRDSTAVTIIPSVGYKFTGWDDGRTDNPRIDYGVTDNIEVTAILVEYDYEMFYASSSIYGFINGNSHQYAMAGEDGEYVTAVPVNGYAFVNWSDGSTVNPRKDLNIQSDINVQANFSQNLVNLVYIAGVHGSITGDLSQSVIPGGNGTAVTAVPDSGYAFNGWSDGNPNATRQDMNVTQALSVTANFITNTLSLTYTPGANGTIQGTLNQSVTYGGNGTVVEAIANLGYDFDKWSDTLSTNATRQDLNVTAPISTTALFKAAGGGTSNILYGGGQSAHPYLCYAFLNTNNRIIMMGRLPNNSGIYYFGDTPTHEGPREVIQPAVELNNSSSKIIKVVMAGTDMFILYNNGNLYFRGYNKYGVSGLGHANIVSTFTLTATNVEDVELSSYGGYYYYTGAMIRKKNGTIYDSYSSGYNRGELGIGTITDTYSWVKTTPLGTSVAQIYVAPSRAIGDTHAALITTIGDVYTTGDNNVGQLGDGTTTTRTSFVKMSLPVGVKAVKLQLNQREGSNRGNTFVLTTDGEVYGCGDNGIHKFNGGYSSPQATPVKMYNGSFGPARDIRANDFPEPSIFVITDSNALYGIGYNLHGELGVGDTVNRSTWTHVLNGVKYVFLGVDDSYSSYTTVLAVTTSNLMYTWGYGAWGTIGDGATTSRNSPTNITNIVASLMDISKIYQARMMNCTSQHCWMIQTNKGTSLTGDMFGWGQNGHNILTTTTTATQKQIIKVYNS